MRDEYGGEHIVGPLGVLTAAGPGELKEEDEGEERDILILDLAWPTANAASTH